MNNYLKYKVIEPQILKKDLEYRIDNLASFAVLGLDVKITPAGEVKVIEVNGINSGMRGYEKAGVRYEDLPLEMRPRRKTIYGTDFDELIETLNEAGLKIYTSCYDALIAHINGMGPLRLFSSYPSCFKIHPDWNSRYKHFADILIGIEEILHDKLQCDKFFDECREIKSRSYEYNEQNFQRLVQTEKPRYVVIKPRDGARGEGVVIVSATELSQYRPNPANGLVTESFVPSKSILSSQDGKYHDGCMRYVIVVEETKQGDINIYHFGGYWRLCPNPISDNLDINAMRANLCKGAFAERVSDKDLALVREIVNRHIPVFYRNLIKSR